MASFNPARNDMTTATWPRRSLTILAAVILLGTVQLSLAADDRPAKYPTRLKASDPSTWRPVAYKALTPTGGVTLDDAGLFKQVMENNIGYLLSSFSVNHMLVPFRQRVGQKNPPDDKPQVQFWDTDLRGSSAGRFLMGAGNTLRWIENPELRKRLNELIDGIEACRGPNGYILAYPPDQVRSEEPNYGRAWFTHGLIDAAIAGNPKAYGLLRGHADWFNQWDMLPKLIYHTSNSHQGHIASTRTYFTPIGKPEDLQVAEKYYVCDWWMDGLAGRRTEAVWKYPLQNPHSYLITSFEAYLDHYRATGDKRYLDASLGAWDMIHDQWEHLGGSMAICEGEPQYPPRSYYLREDCHTGETCGTTFWIKFCQRFQQLSPMDETYANEIEKSIYNVALSCQNGSKGIRYHTRMEGRIEGSQCINTCCEGQGTRLLGSLPEYIYSTADDGLYVNLFEPSSIRWKLGEQTVGLRLQGRFPFDPNVTLQLSAARPTAMKLRLRVPRWAAKDMPIAVNGQQVALGKPGTYAQLDRTWRDGDRVAFTLPMDFRVTRYTGRHVIAGHERYAIEYGPLLLAAVGPFSTPIPVSIAQDPAKPQQWLKLKPGAPLRFAIDGDPAHVFMPHYQIPENQTFMCYVVIEPAAKR